MRQHLVLYMLLGWLHSCNNSVKHFFFMKAYEDEVTQHRTMALDENGNSLMLLNFSFEVAMAKGDEEDDVEDEEEVWDEEIGKIEEEEEFEEEEDGGDVEEEETVQEEAEVEDAEVAKSLKRAHSPSGHTPLKKVSKTRRGNFCIHINGPTNAPIPIENKNSTNIVIGRLNF